MGGPTRLPRMDEITFSRLMLVIMTTVGFF